MTMAGLVKVLFPVFFVFGQFGHFLVHVNVLVLSEFTHDFFDSSFHHSEVLLGVD
jgi:hypothetical protein